MPFPFRRHSPAGLLQWRVCVAVSGVAGAMFPPKHRAPLSHRVKG